MTPVAGFIFDVARCTGCRACELACATENDLGWERSWRRVVTVNEGRRPGLPTFHLSVACNHCEDAPCVKECPALALGRSPLTGAVLVDASACIGCGYCGWVCPWDAPRFDGGGGVMDKCTLCDRRLAEGLEPACVVACPTAALEWGMPSGSRADGSPPGFPVADVGPRIAFAPWRGPTRGPESTLGAGVVLPPRGTPEEGLVVAVGAGEATLTPAGPAVEDPDRAPTPGRPAAWRTGGGDPSVTARARRIGLRGEATLWIFTTALACLAGWMGAAALRGVGGEGVPLPIPAFLAVLAGAAGVSTLHLGRRARAWRAVLNVRRSRLSREVAAFGVFAATSLGALAWTGEGADLLRWAAAAAGLAAAFFVDRVYDPVRASPGERGGREGAGDPRVATWPPVPGIHSADTLLGALTVAVFLVGWLPGFLALAAVRTALFVRSGASGPEAAGGRGTPGRGPAWATVRLGVGLLVPALALGAAPGIVGWGLAALVVGELVDRARFYEELRAPAVGYGGPGGVGTAGPGPAAPVWAGAATTRPS